MSIAEQIKATIPEVQGVLVEKYVPVYGEDATQVIAYLNDGRAVTGTFTTESRSGFGGVEFDQRKDVVGLMVSKIRAVLDGKAEL